MNNAFAISLQFKHRNFTMRTMSERPVECSQCKKAPKITYKEIIGEKISIQEMCADCPVLLQKLHGITPKELAEGTSDSNTGLYCGHCHTPLETIRMGNPIGCAQCYAVFGDVLCNELLAEDKIPQSMENARRNQPLHIGKTPENPVHIPSSNRITALNESLNEALKKENYEEAAWLRDQINELMEKKDDP